MMRVEYTYVTPTVCSGRSTSDCIHALINNTLANGLAAAVSCAVGAWPQFETKPQLGYKPPVQTYDVVRAALQNSLVASSNHRRRPVPELASTPDH